MLLIRGKTFEEACAEHPDDPVWREWMKKIFMFHRLLMDEIERENGTAARHNAGKDGSGALRS